MKKSTQKAFTLAEIMIVLTVIGILTAIILPSARNLMPDRNLMKFKKAHNTLLTAITELVNSDKYYLDGDLGVKPNGDLIDTTHEGDVTYLCNTMADILNAKKVNCSEFNSEMGGAIATIGKSSTYTFAGSLEEKAETMDRHCKTFARDVKEEIVLADGVVFYQSGPWATFGINETNYRNHTNDFEGTTICQGANAISSNCVSRFFSSVNKPAKYHDDNGFDVMYKIICIDIDGIPDGVNSVDCKNECPFGYALRADGKILAGLRAQEWLERDVSQNN